MQDRFQHHAPGLSAPATRAVAALPSDDLPLPFVSRAIYIGEEGDLATRAADGSEVIWKNIAAGTLLPFRAAMILAEGTTANHLLVLD